LHRLGHLHVVGEGWRARVQDRQLVLLRQGPDVVERQSVRGSVDQPRLRHQGCRLGQPGRVPVGTDLTARLVARAGAAVEAFKGRRVEEQGSLKHQEISSVASVRSFAGWLTRISLPSRSTRNRWPAQCTVRPRKLTAQTARENASRKGTRQRRRQSTPRSRTRENTTVPATRTPMSASVPKTLANVGPVT